MNNFVVAITRTCGSGGMSIGQLLADHYGVNIYDPEASAACFRGQRHQ